MSYLIAVREGDVPERAFWLVAGELSIGSDPAADIRIGNAEIAPREGVLRLDEDGRLFYQPYAGTSGTHFSRDGVATTLLDRSNDGVELRCGDRVAWGRSYRAYVEVLEAEAGAGISMPTPGVTEADGAGHVIAKVPVQSADILDARIRQNDSNALQILYKMARALQPYDRLDELLAATVDQVLGAIPAATHVAVFLAGTASGGSTDLTEPAVVRQRADPRRAPALNHIVSRSVLERVNKERVGVLLMDAQSAFPTSESVAIGGIRSSIVVPLVVGARAVGILQVDNRVDINAFTERDLELLTVFAGQLAAMVANAALRDKLSRAEAALRRENEALKISLTARARLPVLIGDSAAMRQLYRQMEQVAGEKLPLLICGETGTGKEMIARTSHLLSCRREGPFVPLNCGAIAKDLVESELFGHVAGAFTGATAKRGGLFFAASNGTLFLDEVGELPLEAQVKLLRVLEEKTIRPVGSDHFQKVDVRVVAATNRNLENAVASGGFREDLYYRLNVLRLDLPPLRERLEDVPALVERFLSEYCADTGKRIAWVEADALAALLAYPWPGNVRELRNEIDRAAAGTRDGGTIGLAGLSPRVRGADSTSVPVRSDDDRDVGELRAIVESVERRFIENALRRCDGNISRVAEKLGLSRPGLRSKMSRYGLGKAETENDN